ncbi:MAG: Sulfate adenylyltransferase [Phycisphaerae bacterium]|nr:Sulfate adenylyltransferase [Phycisphaerae bacterium]
MSITAHGGQLIQRLVTEVQAGALRKQADSCRSLTLPPREQCDVEMIGMGACSPLTGFMGEQDFHSVCDTMHLANKGPVWPVPITCSTDSATAAKIKIGDTVALRDGAGTLLAMLTVQEKYPHDKQKEARLVYKTEDPAHPGVAVTMQQGEVCLAGPIDVLPRTSPPPFADFYLTPAQTREKFTQRQWRTIVAFQTRNPIHRAHEYITKCALEICDGLLIHPLVGETQEGDIPADVRMECYQVLIEKYYQPKNTMLAVMPAAMRYAGPREAILHAIVRQNYGCTHFIVGRDHAGVGNYYGTYDAQLIFNQLQPGELAISPLNFEHASWCKKCEGMVSAKTCPHGNEDKVFLSGTKVRDLLKAGQRPPMEFTRPEIADLLIRSMK